MDNISSTLVAYHGVRQTYDEYVIVRPRYHIRLPEYNVDGERTNAARKPQVDQQSPDHMCLELLHNHSEDVKVHRENANIGENISYHVLSSMIC